MLWRKIRQGISSLASSICQSGHGWSIIPQNTEVNQNTSTCHSEQPMALENNLPTWFVWWQTVSSLQAGCNRSQWLGSIPYFSCCLWLESEHNPWWLWMDGSSKEMWLMGLIWYRSQKKGVQLLPSIKLQYRGLNFTTQTSLKGLGNTTKACQNCRLWDATLSRTMMGVLSFPWSYPCQPEGQFFNSQCITWRLPLHPGKPHSPYFPMILTS